MHYRPEIDGLRALAVASVVVFHAMPKMVPGGYVGVDVFFVISGFLITTILLNDLQKDRFSIVRFYERRARRILPALVVVILLTLVASTFLLPLEETKEVFESALATALFLANVRFWLKTDYFATVAEERPLLHMWSLAVEEQYYLFFPFLLYLIWIWRKSALLWVLMLLVACSLALAEVLSRTAPVANFFLPMGRMWELLIGSCAACIGARQLNRGVAETLSALGLLMILVPVFVFTKFTPTPSLWTVIPVIGTALIILFAYKGLWTTWLLQQPVLVGLGLISYSVYLYHQPVLAFAKVNLAPGWQTEWVFMGLVGISIFLGYLSWRFVEQPFRNGFTPKTIFALSTASLGGIVALGLTVVLAPQLVRDAYTWTLSDDSLIRYQQIEALHDNSAKDFASGAPCHFKSSYADAAFVERYADCAAEHGPGLLVLGGSHAADLHGALLAASDRPFIAAVALGFCRPHKSLIGPPPHECHYDGVADFVSSHKDDIAHLIYTQAFFPLYDDYIRVTSTAGFRPELAQETVAYLMSLREHVPVTMLGPRRIMPTDPKRLDPRNDLRNQVFTAYDQGTSAAEDLADQTFADLLADTGVGYLSLIELIDTQMPDAAFEGEMLLYHDLSHWNAAGEAYFGARLRQALQPLDSVALVQALYAQP